MVGATNDSGECLPEIIKDYSCLAANLEQQELEAPLGIATPQLYAQLLSIYILQNDLTNAKFLWKRIPLSLKQRNAELGKIWNVGQKLWNRDFPNVYSSLNEEWSDQVKPLMNLIGEVTRKRTLDLVSKAYSSIHALDVAAFLGYPPEKISEVERLGWRFDSASNMVIPQKQDKSPELLTPSEEQLEKLTDFVAFLET